MNFILLYKKMDKKERKKLEEERGKLLKRYLEISKKISKKNAFTKEEALNKTYEVKRAGASIRTFQGRMSLPLCLIGLKVKLVEVK